MAHTWGHLGRQVLGGWVGAPDPVYETPYTQSYVANMPSPAGGRPAYDSEGRLLCKPRRRRRRLLTESDFNDLMRIATLPNKDTVKIALAKAIGRR